MTSTALLQATTIDQATHRGEIWTSAELNFLAECPDIPAVELAETLNRTLYAIYVARQGLADRQAAARRHRATHVAYKAVCLDCGLAPCAC